MLQPTLHDTKVGVPLYSDLLDLIMDFRLPTGASFLETGLRTIEVSHPTEWWTVPHESRTTDPGTSPSCSEKGKWSAPSKTLGDTYAYEAKAGRNQFPNSLPAIPPTTLASSERLGATNFSARSGKDFSVGYLHTRDARDSEKALPSREAVSLLEVVLPKKGVPRETPAL